MLKRYKLTYGGKSVVRRAESADCAVDKLCDQYGWSNRLNLYDADTRGKMWARCYIDKDGGINYDTPIFADLIVDGEEE